MQKITLDIDQYKIYRKTDHINKIVKKIAKLSCSYKLETELSASTNGYHITITCNPLERKNNVDLPLLKKASREKCDICRFVYDDTGRFNYDEMWRLPHEQNILFDAYTIIKNKTKLEFSKV